MENILKCPVCGGDVIGEYCFSCGVAVTGDEMKPSPEAEPPSQARVDLAYDPDYPKVHVMPDGNSAQGSFGGGGQNSFGGGGQGTFGNSGHGTYRSSPHGSYTKAGNSREQYDYQNNYQNENPNDNYSPRWQDAPPQTGFTGFTQAYSEMSFGTKFGKYWWYILLTVLVPGLWLLPALVGVITSITHSDAPSKHFAGEQILLAVVGLFLFF
jgi:hypothetical protein